MGGEASLLILDDPAQQGKYARGPDRHTRRVGVDVDKNLDDDRSGRSGDDWVNNKLPPYLTGVAVMYPRHPSKLLLSAPSVHHQPVSRSVGRSVGRCLVLSEVSLAPAK